MTESNINALVHLFAIIESVKEDNEVVDSGAVIIKPYLAKSLNQELTEEYLRLFYDYLSFYREDNTTQPEESGLGIGPTSMLQVAKICNHLNRELTYENRVIVFLQLLELIQADNKVTPKEAEFIDLVALNFNIRQEEAKSMRSFILDPDAKDVDKDKGLLINNKMIEWPEEMAWMMRRKNRKVPGSTEFHHLYVENLFGQIFVLQIESVGIYIIKYEGPLNLYLEGNRVIQKKFYLLRPGAIIKSPTIRSIYESEITRQFLKKRNKVQIVLTAEKLLYQFNDATVGIHEFTFNEQSGQLLGIMGGSGVGKSTLINLLNGKLIPSGGKVHLNGHSLHKAAMEGVIGYVPQDDLLFEELSVYQNLYFNARICFSDFSDHLLKKTVDKVLYDLDLYEIKDLKVGSPLNKFISGGQRKRLNIALELMREPSVLYVDEPTSGLSSMDSEKVMMLLKDLTRKGKLVVAIIHQPSSDIFKLFDKLWILDKGGYPIFNGNPIDAVVYFKTVSTQVNAAESECPRCGNVIPEQILQIIESKEIDDEGKVTNKRRVPPRIWYNKYKENIESKLEKIRYEERLPPTNFHIPGFFQQFKIFSKRNFLAKLSNKQYIFINLLEAPVLALILGFFSKYAPHGDYLFSENKNLPVYLFMSVVVALFMGMSVSAEEIFRDRKILERESFLNLSRLSYLNSKIFYLFCLSAIQTLSFVLIGNFILEIKGMTLIYWAVLFSTACFANLVGLNISSALNSVITIYILIPFILVPQLLLGGAMIKFDELHHRLARQVYVPRVGDIMASRWAYEALAVGQFRYNAFDKKAFDYEKAASEASFHRSYIIPQLLSYTESIMADSTDTFQESQLADLSLIITEVRRIQSRFDVPDFPIINSLTPDFFQQRMGPQLVRYLNMLEIYFRNEYKEAVHNRDSVYQSLIDRLGMEEFLQLKKDYHNESLATLLRNQNDPNRMVREENILIQKKDPIYLEPYARDGRSHFYAPVKNLFGLKIETVTFNILVLWGMVSVLYFILINDLLRKLILAGSGRKK